MAVQHMPHQLRKRHERRHVGVDSSSHTHPGACRPVEHPGRNLKPAVRIGTAQTTAKNNVFRLLDNFMNADPKTKPWMPRVQQFSKLSSVGILKPRCTLSDARIRALTGARRRRLTSIARPSRRRHGFSAARWT
jgi:hypothetical protein